MVRRSDREPCGDLGCGVAGIAYMALFVLYVLVEFVCC